MSAQHKGLAGFHDQLGQLYATGASYTEIAIKLSHQFGLALTRSAIAGLVYRAKWSRPSRSKGNTKRIRKRSSRPPKASRPDQPASEVVVTPAPPIAPALPAGTYSILDLTPASCRYPIGNGPFLFCGAEAAWPYPYCAEHSQLCYQHSRSQ